MSTAPTVSSDLSPSKGRGWLWLGVGVGMLAIALNLAQIFVLRHLFMPWYMPILGVLGALLILVSVVHRRSLGRMVVLIFFALLAGFELAVVFLLSNAPAYMGPIAGEFLPAFQAKRADGTPFTDADFKGTQGTILVLFRGHW
jgi:hypothetical protein